MPYGGPPPEGKTSQMETAAVRKTLKPQSQLCRRAVAFARRAAVPGKASDCCGDHCRLGEGNLDCEFDGTWICLDIFATIGDNDDDLEVADISTLMKDKELLSSYDKCFVFYATFE